MDNYFRYLPPSPHEDVWGGSVTAIGYTRIGPNIPYPPARHPDDHEFAWERGRILNSFQLVLISDGEGVFESGRPGNTLPVRGGQAFVLFPGVWHRYEPTANVGWVEHWLEYRGRVYEAAWQRGLINPNRPVVDLTEPAALLEVFLRCHDWALRDAPGATEILASLGVHLLGVLVHGSITRTGPEHALERKLGKARRLLIERCDKPLDLHAVAREVGLGYSHFRQAFSRLGGVGARTFHSQARLRRACDLLANSDLSIKEIAELLGFSSAFHFSTNFKHQHGTAPSEWRSGRKTPSHR